MDHEKYKKFHEDQMIDHVGSTVLESALLLSSIPLAVFLSFWISGFITEKFIVLSIQFLVIIFPVILNVTILSDIPFAISLIMAFISLLIFILSFNLTQFKLALKSNLQDKKSCITNYRSSTNFVSVLCILAVDFTVFPRKFAKTETFGFGLMDLGVGFFVCSNGIVVKDLKSTKKISSMLKGASILIVLGLVRLFSVKSIDYHEHVAEYGVHWNFFFTLAFCRIFSYLFMLLTNCFEPTILAVTVGIFHQLILSKFGLQNWVFSDIPRNSFINANREGLVSIFGYVSLYFASVALANLISKAGNISKLLMRLLFAAIVLWTATGIAFETVGVSRRLANVGYNLWILSLTVTKIIEFLIVEVAITTVTKKIKSASCVPALFESINMNGLFFFLFGNLLTGIVNFMFQTLLLDALTSIFIITLYMAINCSISYIFYCKNIIVKFW